jgi:penicillin-binding protein 1A
MVSKKPSQSKGKMARGKSPRKSTRKRILIYSFSTGVILATLVFFFVFIVYLGLFGPIPSKATLSRVRNNSATLVQSYDGKLIGKYFLQNRMTIDQEGISQHVKNALIATEDSRFFKHKGLDFISLGRVFVKSILLGNRSQGGGSTISQQLARNLYPRRDFGRFTLPINKVREIFISARLEKVYTKDEILALYLNTVPYGDNVYGIEVASQRFFGKPSLAVNPSEAATLVGMLAANTAYNPRLNPEKSEQRRNTVLARMADQEFISRQDLEIYKSKPIILNYKKLDYNNGPAPYFLEYIRPQIQKLLSDQYGEDYNIYTDGLIITTTIDSTLQEYADYAVSRQLKQLQKEFDSHWSGREPWSGDPDLLWSAIQSSSRYKLLIQAGNSSESAMEIMRQPIKIAVFDLESESSLIKSISPLDSIKQSLRTLQAGFLAMDPVSGNIKAWVGGRNFEYFKFDHVTSQRQVGSTFKPIVYTAALRSGIDPCEYLSNEVKVYPDYQDWAPENSDGEHEGYYSIKGGLVNSVNTISAQVIDRVGISPVIRQARAMGIQSEIPRVPSIALGSADLSLKEMISAYTSFANLGKPVSPIALLKIQDWEGKLLWEAELPESMDSAMDLETSRIMVEIMRGVIERGTGASLRWLFGLKSDLAGKTGTTQDNADGWFIGYNPAIVAGAWVGADNPSIHFRTTALGQGAHTGLPIFARFMQKIEADRNFKYISTATFPELSPDLSSRLDCLDYSFEDPNMTRLERFFDGLINSGRDSSSMKELKQPDVIKEEPQKKKGFFERMRETFRKKK